jgi:hypothetical protein
MVVWRPRTTRLLPPLAVPKFLNGVQRLLAWPLATRRLMSSSASTRVAAWLGLPVGVTARKRPATAKKVIRNQVMQWLLKDNSLGL